MYVAGFSPATAIAGRPFTVNGRMLKIAGTDSSVGITITDSKEQTTPVDLNMLAVNNPSQLTFIVPAGLADGDTLSPSRRNMQAHAPENATHCYRYFLRWYETRNRRRLRW